MQGKKEPLGRKQLKKQGEDVVEITGEHTKVQFQKIWKETMVGFQNQENISQLQPNTEIIGQGKQKEPKLWSSPLTLLVLLVVILAIEISVEVSVLLIQYICSKLSLNTFCALLTLAIFLLILVILSIIKINSKGLFRGIAITPSNLVEPSPMLSTPESNLATILKIEKLHQSKGNQKTKKLKQCYFLAAPPNSHLSTIKKIKCQDRPSRFFKEEGSIGFSEECSQPKIFLSVKLVQNVSMFVLGCICMSTVQNPKTQGLTYVGALVVLEFVMIILSSLLTHQIYFIASQPAPRQMLVPHPNFRQIQAKIHNFIKEQTIEPSKPQTALSIDQHLHSQSSVPQTPLTNGQIIQSRHSFTQKDQEFSPEIILSPAEELKLLELTKKKRNKSVLKAQKSVKSRGDAGNEDDCSEDEQDDPKKKVEINFKQIQYFEYDRSSPANSVLCESQATQNKSKIRSKYSIARSERYSEIHEAEKVNQQIRKDTKRRTKSVSQFQEPETLKKSPVSTRFKFRAGYT